MCLKEPFTAMNLSKKALSTLKLSEDNKTKISLYLVESFLLQGNWNEAMSTLNNLGVGGLANMVLSCTNNLNSNLFSELSAKVILFLNLASIQLAKGDLVSGQKSLNQALNSLDKEKYFSPLSNLYLYLFLRQCKFDEAIELLKRRKIVLSTKKSYLNMTK